MSSTRSDSEELEGYDAEKKYQSLQDWHPEFQDHKDAQEKMWADHSARMTNRIDYKCESCGWDNEWKQTTLYNSSVKLLYVCADRAVWKIGENQILKDQNEEGIGRAVGCEERSINFIRNRTSIPVRQNATVWSSAGRRFTLMSYIEGEPADKLIEQKKISQAQIDVLSNEVGHYLYQLRKLQSPVLTTLEGTEPAGGYKLGIRGDKFPASREAFMTYLEQKRRPAPNYTQKELKAFRERMPKFEPFTYTHGDVKWSNVIVREGHVAGIIDWEQSGFYPVFWEYVVMHYLSKPKGAWSHYVGEYPEALQWVRDLNKYYPYDQSRVFW